MALNGKTILLIVLNLAGAALLGIIAGLFYKSHYSEPPATGPSVLREQIASVADTVDARVEVAVIFSSGDTLVYVNAAGQDSASESRFPMLSVFKFHQALGVCSWLRHAGLTLDDKVMVSPDDLPEGTWSPMRDEHPGGGAFSYRELMTYSLASSDNNATDILFSHTGGPVWTEEYIRSYGITDFNIECTESMMHEDPRSCYRNWSTPLSAAMLLEKFWTDREMDTFSRFVWDTMSACRTGQSRIPGLIADRASVIAHKTGTGDISPDGRTMAVNDIGIVVLPDGSHFSIAVFISDAGCPLAQCESLIASITALAYDYSLQRSPPLVVNCFQTF